ncbi:glucosamine-6-phosphate deaminase [[Clostridium] innocuum]|nr:glucosamine-6-phosphate deaminase [[Clostridium] innocuum]MCR0576076.1 glucosamine-6-phosphate deaminase [[Clostridium] innocuum]
MKVFVVKDYDALSRKTAEIVVDQIRRKPDTIFCLPAGGSPIGMYKVLVDMYQQHEVDFSRLITFDMDEYVGIGPRDENSYAYFMQKHFLKYVNVDPKNVHYPDGLAEDIDEMCRLYSEQIFAMGGLDIAITGIGDDGHVAFNEPGDALYPRTHAVDLAESTRRANARFFDGDITRVPKRACSIGMEDIMRTKTFLVVASGKHKAELIRKTFCEEMIDPQWPVSFCRMHSNCIFIIDEDAASACDPNVWKPYQ